MQYSVTPPRPDRGFVAAADERAPAEITETMDLLEPLAALLGADGALLSLHFNEGSPAIILDQCGAAGEDEQLAASALAHAEALHDAGPEPDDTPVERGWLGTLKGPAYKILSLPFRCRRAGSEIIFSGLFGRAATPDRKILAAAVQRSLPLLDAYFGLWQRCRSDALHARGLHDALDSLKMGVALIDCAGSLRFCNAQADALLRDGRIIRRRGNSLTANKLSETMKLQAALAVAIEESEVVPAGRSVPDLLRLRSGSDQLMLAVLPTRRRIREPGAIAAIVVMLDPQTDSELLAAPVCKLYGLSPVETRLACHIVGGRSLLEASEAMRIKEQTARTYLKQIFLKTNVNRQTDLIRLLLSSIVHAGAGCHDAANCPPIQG